MYYLARNHAHEQGWNESHVTECCAQIVGYYDDTQSLIEQTWNWIQLIKKPQWLELPLLFICVFMLTWFSTWNCTRSSWLCSAQTLTLPSCPQVAKCCSSGLQTTPFTYSENTNFSILDRSSVTFRTFQCSLWIHFTAVDKSCRTLLLWPLISRILVLSVQLMYHRVPAVVPTIPMSMTSSNTALTTVPSNSSSCSSCTWALPESKQVMLF